MLANFEFSLAESALLAGLFLTQLVSVDPTARMVYSWVYVGLALALLAVSRDHRLGMMEILRLRRAGAPRG